MSFLELTVPPRLQVNNKHLKQLSIVIFVLFFMLCIIVFISRVECVDYAGTTMVLHGTICLEDTGFFCLVVRTSATVGG